MGEESRQLKEHIDETRSELGHNIDDLEAKIKRIFNWRAQFEDHPMTAIGLAFGAGVLLSAIASPRLRRPSNAEFLNFNSANWNPEETRLLKKLLSECLQSGKGNPCDRKG